MVTRNWIGPTALAAAVVIAPAFAQSTAAPTHDHGQAAPAAHDHEQAAPAEKKGMMGHDHQMMTAEMKATDKRLQDLVSRMKTATGDQQIAAMADLLTQLVAEQTKMHHHMMEMHDQMMSHK